MTIPTSARDYRLQLDLVPEPGTTRFGIGLRAGSAGAEDGCDLVFHPAQKRVAFSKMSDSGGGIAAGPGIEAVEGLDQPFTVDIVVRHDILDAEIAGFRSLTTRFWNPEGARVRLFVDGGEVTFRNIRMRCLAERYAPYPTIAANHRENRSHDTPPISAGGPDVSSAEDLSIGFSKVGETFGVSQTQADPRR